jgi:hypothetical protein
MARKSVIIKVVALTGLALAVSGCDQARETFGLNKQSPDEFRVVSRAPLSVPPDFTLRVPAPGAPRPQSGTTTDQARNLLTGEDPNAAKQQLDDGSRSKGEVAILAKSGAAKADPNIRTEVDRETSALVQENQSVMDRLLFWRAPEPVGTEVDPAKESQRIRDQQALGNPANEGGATPTIQRKKRGLLEGIF